MTDSRHSHDPKPGEGPAKAGLEERLTHSAPNVTESTPELRSKLEDLAAQVRTTSSVENGTVGRRRISRGAAFGLAACVLLGGATAAVAMELRQYWVDLGTGPHGSYTVELPSGATCEVELRMVVGGRPGVVLDEDTFAEQDTYAMTDEQEDLARRMGSDAQEKVDEIIESEDFQEWFQQAQELDENPEPPSSDNVWTLPLDEAYFVQVQSRAVSGMFDSNREEADRLQIGGYTWGQSCPGAEFGERDFFDMDSTDMDSSDEDQEGAE